VKKDPCTRGDIVGRRTNARGVNSAILCPMHEKGNKLDCSN
jgi:hypothetical protein